MLNRRYLTVMPTFFRKFGRIIAEFFSFSFLQLIKCAIHFLVVFFAEFCDKLFDIGSATVQRKYADIRDFFQYFFGQFAFQLLYIVFLRLAELALCVLGIEFFGNKAFPCFFILVFRGEIKLVAKFLKLDF